MENELRTLTDANDGRINGDWGTMWILANDELGNSPQMTVGRVIIKSGKCNPRHSHPNCMEVLHLLSGSLEYYMKERVYKLSPGDTLCIEPGVPHYGKAVGSEDAEIIVAFNSGVREFQPEP